MGPVGECRALCFRTLDELTMDPPGNLGSAPSVSHEPGDACTSPQRSTRPFTVIHINGIHLVDVWFCGCDLAGNHGDRVEQLLRRRLFPATTTDPQTASTFALLEYAHVLSVQSKLSLYDLYISIEILTVEQAVVYSTLPQEYSTLTFGGEVVADGGGVEERSEVMYWHRGAYIIYYRNITCHSCIA